MKKRQFNRSVQDVGTQKKVETPIQGNIMHLCERTDQIQSTDQTSGGICSVNETGFSS